MQSLVNVPSQTSRALLLAEFLTVFFVLPFLFFLIIQGTPPYPFIVASGIFACFYLLRDKEFPRSGFADLFSLKDQGRRIFITFFHLALVALIVTALISPEYLFDYPRNKTNTWLFIMIFYPLLAVYPQELFYRAFLFRRYRPLFPSDRSMIFASALTFGFAHIIYGNIPAVLLTLVGGFLFAITYQRSQSILLVSLEHALYGCLLYTVGMGQFIDTHCFNLLH
ncbi:MAG: hypothetical protein BWK76_15920 [Desulfobulbaceae bacterium A2]|nr:MAG: hypothetical protein BWK76_15920 [Desulfobulbaceae bacterium A2]